MDNFKQQAKKYGKRGWNFLKEKVQRFWVVFRRVWKKYHVTKVGLLVILSAGLFLSAFLTIQARQVDVDILQVGLQEPTKIMDDQGEVAGSIYSEKGSYKPLEEISPSVQKAVISTEDQSFMSHRGFDPIGIGRAAFGYVTQGEIVGGGSTITQQLAKNAYLTADQTLLRKLKELFLAIEIEKSYPKDEILEMYLNNSYFGQGVWGVQDASKKYFNKNASELSISEGATLAGLLQSPSNTNPIDNYERSINRRDTVLMLMEETGAITAEERQAAAGSELVLVDGYNFEDTYRYPSYFDAVITEATSRYDFEESEILNGGYTIYTSLNQNQQQQMDGVYSDSNDWLFETAPDGTESQSASVALNPQTGGVTAIMGGRDYEPRGWNRALEMKRQPGSTIKPLSVYAPALESGYEIDSILEDELTTYGADENGEGGVQYSNVDHTYAGEVPMYEALGRSKNAATVWLLDQIGIDKGYSKLRDFGIPVEAEKERSLGAIALGGMEGGVNPLQMASAYSVFANDGVRVEPYFITQIVDPTGAVVVDNDNPREKRVLSTEVNDDMNRMLLYVFSNGNAQVAQPAGYDVAGKTGTTEVSSGSGINDQWIVGYTPDIVIASWAGYDQPENYHLTNYASSGIGQVLKAEFEAILPYTENTQFAVDDEDIQVIVRDNRQNETMDRIREGLERTGEVLEDTTRKAIDGAKNLWDSFRNR